MCVRETRSKQIESSAKSKDKSPIVTIYGRE
jgi:hypothetical protein